MNCLMGTSAMMSTGKITPTICSRTEWLGWVDDEGMVVVNDVTHSTTKYMAVFDDAQQDQALWKGLPPTR